MKAVNVLSWLIHPVGQMLIKLSASAGLVLSALNPFSLVGKRPTSRRNVSTALSNASSCDLATVISDLPSYPKYFDPT